MVLKEVSKIGYDGIEFAGYYNKSPQELKKMLDDLNLKVAGTHLGINTLLGDELKKTVEFNQILGNKYLIVPGLPEEMRSSNAKWLETAKLFNQISYEVGKAGLYVGYHNHHIEFEKKEGNETPFDVFFQNTDTRVLMQFDVGNAMHAGITNDDVSKIIKSYPKRALTIHAKEYSSKNDKALVGEREVNWRDFIKLCSSIGDTEWYIIEQESYAFPPLKCIKKCYDNLRKIADSI